MWVGGGVGREGGSKRIPSRLRTVSIEPDSGLEHKNRGHKNREIMT